MVANGCVATYHILSLGRYMKRIKGVQVQQSFKRVGVGANVHSGYVECGFGGGFSVLFWLLTDGVCRVQSWGGRSVHGGYGRELGYLLRRNCEPVFY